MYESHFGFHRPPFAACDGRSSFFSAESVQRILPSLLHTLKSSLGIAVVTGPAGCGKTTLLRHLRHLLANDGRVLVCSSASLETTGDLHRLLLTAARQPAGQAAAAELPTTVERRSAAERALPVERASHLQVIDSLQRTRSLWGPAFLLIDDAHLLSGAVLNELRACTEHDDGCGDLVRCLLCGPLQLEEELARPAHSEIGGRIRCHVFLQPFTLRESAGYLRRQLQQAGARTPDIFADEALEELIVACDGLPRCLNLLADEALWLAAERGLQQVDSLCVRSALQRLQHLPYAWNLTLAGAGDDGRNAHMADGYVTAAPGASADTRQSAAVETTRSHVAAVPGTAAARNSVPVDKPPQAVEIMAHGVVEFGAAPVRSAPVHSAPVHNGGLPATEQQPAATDTDTHRAVAESSPSERCDTTSLPGSEQPAEMRTRPETPQTTDIAPVPPSALVPGSAVVVNEAVVPADVVIPTEATREPRRTVAELPAGEVADRLPVFDRYTWVALGREVPAGAGSVTVRQRELPDDPCWLTTAASGWQNCEQLPIMDCTDAEVMALLAAPLRGAAVVVNDGHHMSAAAAAGESWKDGQLLQAARGSRRALAETLSEWAVDHADLHPADTDPADEDLDPEASEAEEMVSIPFPGVTPQPACRTEQPQRPVEPGTAGAVGSDSSGRILESAAAACGDLSHGPLPPAVSAAAAGGQGSVTAAAGDRVPFYTLPGAIADLSVDRRLAAGSGDDVYPLAESVAHLQAEVQKFQGGIPESRTSLSEDRGSAAGLPWAPSDSADGRRDARVLYQPGSLLQQANQLLLQQAARAAQVAARTADMPSVSAQSEQNATAAVDGHGLLPEAAESAGSPRRFQSLFTRLQDLRRMRRL